MPEEFSLAMFGSVDVLTFIACFIRPGFDTVSMLLVFFPFTFIDSTIVVNVLAAAVRFVIAPLTLVNVSIRVNQTTDSICFSDLPLTFIERSVWPDLSSLAGSFFQVFLPLANVDGSAGKSVWALLDAWHSILSDVRDLKRTLPVVDFFDFGIEEEVGLCDVVIKLAHLGSVLQEIANCL